MPDRVDRRTLNRTLLARQWLFPRAPAGTGAAAAIGHLVGMQAQDPQAPYVGLWSRLPDFDPAELSGLLTDRSAVRIATLRGTVHLHTAADAHPLREWTQPVIDAQLRSSRKQAWAHVDRAELTTEARRLVHDALVQDAPISSSALGAALHSRWPEVDPADLHQFARCFLPLVQVPPRGLWRRSGAPAYAVAGDWLTDPPEPVRPATVVARYLAAFGPASVKDVQAWCGLTRLREVTATMDLRRYTDDDGVELLDLPDLELADGGADVPPLFTAPFDNLTLAHADRTRVVDEENRQRHILTGNGLLRGMVLLDGEVAGVWRRDGDTLAVETTRTLPKRTAARLTRPGRDLLGLLTGAAGPVVVRPAA